MEKNITTITPSITMLAPVAASDAALVAYPCATSAPSIVAPSTDVQGIDVRTWDVAVKRPVTAAGMGHVAFATTVLGSSAWSPPN
jgi:hypothetical protein